MRPGILSIQEVSEAVERGHVSSREPLENSQFQPNSLDLRIGGTAYRTRCSFLPVGANLDDLLSAFSLGIFDLTRSEGVVLEPGRTYILPLLESLRLPGTWGAIANPKSTTGRLDILARVITQGGHAFDTIPKGYSGPLYLEVVTRSFPLRLRVGDSLCQLRLFEDHPQVLTDEELKFEIDKHRLVMGDDGAAIPAKVLDLADGVFLSVRLSMPCNRTIGYSARRTTPIVDFQQSRHDVFAFWNEILGQKRGRGTLILEPEEFYLFSSLERVRIPPHLCAEMVAYDPKSGELRTHYAGFFDSGFGWNGDGANVVLEVRNRDIPYLLQNGQKLFRLRFFRNRTVPTELYGKGLHSHYQGQSLALPRQFSDEKRL